MSVESGSVSCCPICRTDITQSTDLHTHLKSSHGYIKCELCPINVFIAPDGFKQHINKNHRDKVEPLPETETPSKVPRLDEEQSQSTLKQKLQAKDALKGFFLQTVLECKECEPSKRFSFVTSWTGHIKSVHNINSLADYKAKHGDPCLVKFKHNCRLCNTKMNLNHYVMKRHLAVKHQTTIENYLEKFSEELIEERKQRPNVSSSSSNSSLDGWWMGCVYTCQLCEVTKHSEAALENHLSSCHSITGRDEIKAKYIDKFGWRSTVNRLHTCYICNRQVRHEYKAIWVHLNKKHKMSIEMYTRTYKARLKDELLMKGMKVVERDKENVSVSIDNYLETQFRLGKESKDDPSWSNLSLHQCGICSKQFWSNLKFHWHIKRAHNIASTRDYRRDHGDPEVSLRQHKCQECGHLIKWEANRLRDHLKAAHKMVLSDYGSKHQDYIDQEVRKVKEGSEDSLSYTPQQWKDLFTKKMFSNDKIECSFCHKVVNRHSFKKHLTRSHPTVKNVGSWVTQEISTEQESSNDTKVTPTKSEETILSSTEEPVLEDEDIIDESETTYIVDRETGEILNVSTGDDDEDEEYEDEDVGPLLGQVMEIDAIIADTVDTTPEHDVKIIVLNQEEAADYEIEDTGAIDDTELMMDNVKFVVADEDTPENDDTAGDTTMAKRSVWKQLGSDEDYCPKVVSRSRVEAESGMVSEGTVVSQWTKMAGERTRVSSSKLVTPRLRDHGVTHGHSDTDISAPCYYSVHGQLVRDVGCQVTHLKNIGLATHKRDMGDIIRTFVESGGVLDRLCPGCGKMMSRPRNLVSHIQIIHGVELAGLVREEHDARHSRENVRVQCSHCSKVVSRKSIRRHLKLCHPEHEHG